MVGGSDCLLVLAVGLMVLGLCRSQESRPIVEGLSSKQSLEGVEPGRLRAQKNEAKRFRDFKEQIGSHFNVDQKLLDLEEVRKWYQEEIISNNKTIDFDNTSQMKSMTSQLSNIWCAFCQNSNHCPCIKRWCAVDTCL